MSNTTTELVSELETNLEQFCGTEQYYKCDLFSNLNVTDGVQYLREKANCYWLTDIISSYSRELRNHSFQVWTLKLNKTGNGAKVECTDGNGKRLIVQRISYTDFPLKEIELYCSDGVILLPSEY